MKFLSARRTIRSEPSLYRSISAMLGLSKSFCELSLKLIQAIKKATLQWTLTMLKYNKRIYFRSTFQGYKPIRILHLSYDSNNWLLEIPNNLICLLHLERIENPYPFIQSFTNKENTISFETLGLLRIPICFVKSWMTSSFWTYAPASPIYTKEVLLFESSKNCSLIWCKRRLLPRSGLISKNFSSYFVSLCYLWSGLHNKWYQSNDSRDWLLKNDSSWNFHSQFFWQGFSI